jgi:hypothetical protein
MTDFSRPLQTATHAVVLCVFTCSNRHDVFVRARTGAAAAPQQLQVSADLLAAASLQQLDSSGTMYASPSGQPYKAGQ